MALQHQQSHIWQCSFASLCFSVPRSYKWFAALCHLMGGNCDFSGLSGNLYLHLLLPKRSSDWQEHHPQEPVYQPFPCRASLPHRYWQNPVSGVHRLSISFVLTPAIWTRLLKYCPVAYLLLYYISLSGGVPHLGWSLTFLQSVSLLLALSRGCAALSHASGGVWNRALSSKVLLPLWLRLPSPRGGDFSSCRLQKLRHR